MVKLFDYCISNPPYQVINSVNGVGRINYTKIYDLFQKLGLALADNNSMIYPAAWKSRPQFGLAALLSNNGLYSIDDYAGHSIFSTSIRKHYPLCVVICHKGYMGDVYINGITNNRFSNYWVSDNYTKILLNITNNCPKLKGGVFHLTDLYNLHDAKLTIVDNDEDKYNISNLYIKKRVGAQADGAWVKCLREALLPHIFNMDELSLYKVAIQSRFFKQAQAFNEIFDDGNSNFGIKVFPSNYIFSRTWMNIQSFNTLDEANNFTNYLNCRLIVYLLLHDSSIRTFGSFVPDLEDYSNNNPLFMSDDGLGVEHEYFGLSLNDRLIKYFNLCKEDIMEINIVESELN